MRESIKVLADLGAGIVVLGGIAGALMIVLGVLILIEGGSSDAESASQTFASVDNWLRRLQTRIDLQPTRLFGSYGMALGTKLVAAAALIGAIFDIMYSLRTLAGHRRR